MIESRVTVNRRALPSLSSYAYNALLAFFDADLKIGQRVPVQQDLARRCGASRTTIHRILLILKRAGLLRQKKRGGLFLARRPKRKDFLPQPSALSRREEVEQSLIRMLVGGHFNPGEFFSELALARQHGVTTGTVREALLGLARLGVFTKQARRQWQVVRIGPEIINELMDLRILLELFALDRLMSRKDDKSRCGIFLKIQRRMQKLDRSGKLNHGDFFHLDRELHKTILESADNRYVVTYSQHVSFPIQLQFLHQAFDETLLRLGLAQHLSILDAITAHDKRAALAQLKTHLETARQTLLNLPSPAGT